MSLQGFPQMSRECPAASKDKPIIFSAPMIRAMLDGRKTQTRRVLKDAPKGAGWHCDPSPSGLRWVADGGIPSMPVRLPWRVCDRLWGREACGRRVASFLGIEATNGVEEAFYAADGEEIVNEHGFNIFPWWKGKGACSPIHMPRWASRLTLTVTEVRVQRLQEISEEDAIAEGLFQHQISKVWAWASGNMCFSTPRQTYEALWGKLHGIHSPDGWDANPWVAALTFTVERRNIDAPIKGGASCS